MHLLVLGAFRHKSESEAYSGAHVSMHLLVLGAFRLRIPLMGVKPSTSSLNAPSGAWCFPTYPQKTAPQRRLLERNRRRPRKHRIRPARTAPIKPHNRRKPPQTTPAPPTPPTHQYTTGFQQTQAKKPPPRTFAIVSNTGENRRGATGHSPVCASQILPVGLLTPPPVLTPHPPANTAYLPHRPPTHPMPRTYTDL